MKRTLIMVFAVAFASDSTRAADDTPIGTIVAWHKSLPNTPVLQDDWVECNGQVLNDPASPLDGQTIPDLNGQERFLRGSAMSGENQDATQVTVTVETSISQLFYNNGASASATNSDFDEVTSTTSTQGVINRDSQNTASGVISSGRVRPKNMSVVWIMKVKSTPDGTVPTVGGWGLIIMGGLILVAATIIFGKQRGSTVAIA